MKFKEKIKFFNIVSFFLGVLAFLPRGGGAIEGNKEPSLENKIGSMLMMGFKGSTLQEDSTLSLKECLREGKVGGVILYRHNVENPDQLKALVDGLKEGLTKKVFIAVDQEGGRVQRLREENGFTVFSPSAQQVAATLSPEAAKEAYSITAQELKKYGINVNLGPVSDLNPIDYVCPVIGGIERSYGSDVDKVVEYNKAFVQAHSEAGILSAAKHYPGHGYAKGDTHKGFVNITETVSPLEMSPFLKLIEWGQLPMIMTAHVTNTNVDPTYPATLSKAHLKPLRDAFSGLVVTDALDMGAIKENFGLKKVLEKAINAGCDLLLFSNNPAAASKVENFSIDPHLPEKIINIVIKLINKGKISSQRIEESYQRIEKALSLV
jgi:beta-N-acetylhexosaminidase